jgi:hypothetical protein
VRRESATRPRRLRRPVQRCRLRGLVAGAAKCPPCRAVHRHSSRSAITVHASISFSRSVGRRAEWRQRE